MQYYEFTTFPTFKIFQFVNTALSLIHIGFHYSIAPLVGKKTTKLSLRIALMFGQFSERRLMTEVIGQGRFALLDLSRAAMSFTYEMAFFTPMYFFRLCCSVKSVCGCYMNRALS
jgi:hypothetical protein